MAIDHFQKHKNSIGRTDWNFNFLFDTQPQVAELAAKYAPLIDHPGLHQTVPPQWLHATLLRVGYIDEFSEQEILAIAASFETKLKAIKLPKFILGGWWLWGGGPCLHITPDEPLHDVFDALIESVVEVVGANRTPKTSFIPHVTLAYARTYNNETELFRRLASNPVESCEMRIESVSLIRQKMTEDYYVWDQVKDLSIGQLES